MAVGNLANQRHLTFYETAACSRKTIAASLDALPGFAVIRTTSSSSSRGEGGADGAQNRSKRASVKPRMIASNFYRRGRQETS